MDLRGHGRCDEVPVYGLDIETDTTIDGLDPDVAGVVAVAVASATGIAVLDHPDEGHLLSELSGLLAVLPAGVLVTWNGATFDLPFLDARARRHGCDLGLRIDRDLAACHPYADDPYYRGTFHGTWHDHRHLDAYRVYRRDVGPALRISCGLKSIAGFVGLDPISVDASRIHDLTPDDLRAYVASDARCARELALLRWSTASRAIDPVVDRHPEQVPLAPPPHLTERVGALR